MMRGGVVVKGVLLPVVCGLVMAMAVPAAARKWTSKDGRFSTEAELIEVADGKVTLKKESGDTITVPLDRLSMADRRYVASMKNKLAEKNKAAEAKKPAISYVNQVQPFLVTYCVECHNQGLAKDGYKVTTYETLTDPGKKGPLVIPGKPDESRLSQTIRGRGEYMPPAGHPQPSKEEIAMIVAWVEAGAPNDNAEDAKPKPRSGRTKSRR